MGFLQICLFLEKKVSDVWKLALEEKTTSPIVAENLNALHWTGQNFVIMKHDLN